MSSHEAEPQAEKSGKWPKKHLLSWWRHFLDTLNPLVKRPLFPGVLITLIGLCFLLFRKKLNGVIVCYAGVLVLIVGVGHIWMAYIRQELNLVATRRPDIDAADRRAQSENAVLVICSVVGIVATGLAIVCGATVTVFKDGTAIGLLWALGSMFAGGSIGFLFGIPIEADTPNSKVHINTSLNQISEWLTKIIVGVSLVNAKNAHGYFLQAANMLGTGLAGGKDKSAATAFAAGLIVTFVFLGFTGTYLLARLWISAAIVRADLLTSWLTKKWPKEEAEPHPIGGKPPEGPMKSG
jgi:hypothetical protein